ncbi:hypothetical protein X777_07517 [Ooceraea biroi]|uniref:Uncharacterized protein n=1 Tax=Ooceraea biroi TaxID=2015173 RepID=A0A026X374_OOCBI|nr:hypothetical protein X777_07517 [Ooceraea biroi]
MAARVVVVVVIVVVVARLTGVTGAIELFVGNKRAQVVEADVARAAVAGPALAGVQALLRVRKTMNQVKLKNLVHHGKLKKLQQQRGIIKEQPKSKIDSKEQHKNNINHNEES